MAGNWRHGCWRLGLVMVLGVQGAIASFDCAQAQQVVPDATLPINSTVSVNGNNFIINGGTQAGGNLFHSFSEFSVPTNGLAFFNNAQTIQNIISRVTGSSVSNIDGILGANGTANLFLLNPQGIVFGPNARLNLGGSFVASTASSLNFADGTKFSATTPENAPLLTVSVPLGLQFGTNAGSIQNQSGVLVVQPGNTLALVGGDVSLDGGIIGTLNGQVELGGLTAPGIVGLNADNLRLSFPEKVQRASVSLTNDATVAVFGGGGNIAVNARNLNISGASQIVAAIPQGVEAVGSKAANIEIDATDTVTLEGTSSTASPSSIANFVQGVGTAGNIFINTGSLNIIGNALISSVTQGQGDAGSVTIRALDAVSLSGTNSSILSVVDSEGIGNAGDINIQARSLSLSNGARIGFVTNGQGDAGSVTIRALDAVSLSGRNSSIFSAVKDSGIGNAGDINIQARSLSLSDNAQVATSTLGTGNAGNIQINTLDNISINNGSLIRADTFSNGNAGNIAIQAGGAVSFDGIGSFGVTSGVFTLVGTGLEFPGTGKGGDININARSLSLLNGAQLNASTFGQGDAGSIFVQAKDSVSVVGVSPVTGDASRLTAAVNPGAIGNAGNLTINTGKLMVRDGGQISSSTSGKGDAGNLLVRASEFVQAENSPGVLATTGLFALVNPTGEGNAKDLTIETGTLTLRNGAQVNATTFGKGNAGNLNIRASDINLIGISPQDMFPSALQVRVEPKATGNGGNLTIDTQRLSVTGGARVAADTTSIGNAGNLTVRAKDSVEVVGASPIIKSPSLLTAAVNPGAIGKAGDLTIETGQLIVKDTAQVTVNSQGTGDAGELKITAGTIRLDNQGKLIAETASGNGGNILLRANDLLVLRRGSQISTTAGNDRAGGNGGNITINTPFIIAVPNEDSNISANAFSGRGGRVNITANGVYGIQFRRQPTLQSDITASSQLGVAGVVEINTPDIDPSRGLIPLPAVVVNSPGLIASNCNAFIGKKGSEFTITGRGGLPLSPDDFLSSDVVWSDTRLAAITTKRQDLNTSTAKFVARSPVAIAPGGSLTIVPATGWIFNNKGEVTLISHAANTERQDFGAATCAGNLSSSN
ncbi:filamentous hemagglutinin N-terminal domain-containing protein [Hassallia byssoidea VB512170]|uniref:Filamentous hemagglutinin N-terminal domain-containing protein n=1 Tax=Hassallia byssoidea VB512170 TaxID=1304833 RepID=A0A846HE68_9CYAN|nr:filamentous hemagglutinin N-terminal domain-containing protein [Hassalia byssoidea]NEU75635.1 filamentous hemagglutinin N-terminal domain-containing protein [Hassalia byssoidea VB512170]